MLYDDDEMKTIIKLRGNVNIFLFNGFSNIKKPRGCEKLPQTFPLIKIQQSAHLRWKLLGLRKISVKRHGRE